MENDSVDNTSPNRVFKCRQSRTGPFLVVGVFAGILVWGAIESKIYAVIMIVCSGISIYAALKLYHRHAPSQFTVFDDQIEVKTLDGRSFLALASENWQVLTRGGESNIDLKFICDDRWVILSEDVDDVRGLLSEIIRIWPGSYQGDPYWEPGKKWTRW